MLNVFFGTINQNHHLHQKANLEMNLDKTLLMFKAFNKEFNFRKAGTFWIAKDWVDQAMMNRLLKLGMQPFLQPKKMDSCGIK